jgi:hypothetical protein
VEVNRASSAQQFSFAEGFPLYKLAAEPVPILPNDTTTPAGSPSWREQERELCWKRVVSRQTYSRPCLGNVGNSAKAERYAVANVNPSRANILPAGVFA